MRKHNVIACGCKHCLSGNKRKEAFHEANKRFRRLSKKALKEGDFDQIIVSAGYTD